VFRLGSARGQRHPALLSKSRFARRRRATIRNVQPKECHGHRAHAEYLGISFSAKTGILIVHLVGLGIGIGLALVWLSGIGFLLNYYFYNPVGLANPKVWAKVSIVAVLTLNGVFVHKAILPLIKRNVGRALFDGVSPAMEGVFLASGAVSATSWYVPLVLGALPEINYVVSAQTILAIYAGILSVAIACTVVGGRIFTKAEVREPSLQPGAPTLA